MMKCHASSLHPRRCKLLVAALLLAVLTSASIVASGGSDSIRPGSPGPPHVERQGGLARPGLDHAGTGQDFAPPAAVGEQSGASAPLSEAEVREAPLLVSSVVLTHSQFT